MGTHEVVLPVRFGQVDYAGIMFYPRFFENFHTVFEDMFSERLGVPYDSILRDRRIGFPTVRIETDFRKPFRFGEPMRLALDVLKLGRSSITFRWMTHSALNPAEFRSFYSGVPSVAVYHLNLSTTPGQGVTLISTAPSTRYPGETEYRYEATLTQKLPEAQCVIEPCAG